MIKWESLEGHCLKICNECICKQYFGAAAVEEKKMPLVRQTKIPQETCSTSSTP